MTSNPNRTRSNLGNALLELHPVRHPVMDPHYSLTRRPIDSRWHHAGFTGIMSGFNPALHTHFYAAESALERWLEDPTAPSGDHESQVQLVKEALAMAHDYLHSWAYRALAMLEPDLIGYGPITHDNLDMQAFFLVLTEAIAVVGLDYWYLCVADVDARCGVHLGVGPRTVHYREQLLGEYRRCNPSLTVQDPRFFHQILRLYCFGVIDGFSAQDLIDNAALASWLIRELLIAPRQREVCRAWLSRLGGFELSNEELTRPFPVASESLRHHLAQLSELLWRKIKHGEDLFYPIPPGAQSWRYPAGASVDFRFANLQRLARPAFEFGAPTDRENISFFIDQYLSRFRFPGARTPAAIEALRCDINAIKANFDTTRLERLAATLTPVRRGAPDQAPLELLFVN